MAYRLEIDRSAYKVFRKLPKEVQAKIMQQAQILRDEPLAGKPLKGKYRSLRSLKFNFKGSIYRIVHQIFTNTSTIVIRLAGTRENFYRRLEAMG